MEDDRDFWGDEPDKQTKELLGYCFYDKTEIYEGDPYVIYEGNMYHKENFILLNLGDNGGGINDE